MSLLYLTADQISAQSGGGRVTQEESTALLDLAVERGEEFLCWGRDELQGPGEDPWTYDQAAYVKLVAQNWSQQRWPTLCHIYAGTFTETVTLLIQHGCKVSYTAAAHSISKSYEEHFKLGVPYDYPHLIYEDLWKRYVGGYCFANRVICPSQHSAECMRSYGCKNIEVIPHGVDIPGYCPPVDPRFIVGYLGAYGPDKGIIYLLQAWKKLLYKDAILILGGRDSHSIFVKSLVEQFGAGAIMLSGWQENIHDFYEHISLYIQPSITEGFGIEVLEAMAHSRAVLCSTGAGAADVVPDTWRFPARDVAALADKIDQFRHADLDMIGKVGRGLAQDFTWDKIRARYQQVWKDLLV